MDNLGVAINDTALSAYALEKGLGKTTKQMTTAEKVTLAYQMFLEKTAYAAGNYNKENDTFAGSLNTLNAAWENLLAGVGDGTELVDALVGKNGNGGALGAIFKTAERVLPKLWDGLTKGVKAAWPKVTKFLGQKLDKLPTALGPMLSSGVNGLLGIVNSLFGTDFQPINIELPSFSEMGKRINEWWNADSGVGKILHDVCDWTIGLFKPPEVPDDATVGEILDAWWGQTQTSVSNACEWLLGLFTNVDGSPTDVSTKISEWWDGLGIAVADVADWLISKATGVEGDGEAIRGIIQKWWNDNGNTGGKLVEWFLSLPTGVMSANEAGTSLHDIIDQWWTDNVGDLVSIFQWAFGIPDNPDAEKTAGAVNNWWNNFVKPNLKLVAEFTLGLFGHESVEEFGASLQRDLTIMMANVIEGIGGGMWINAIPGLHFNRQEIVDAANAEYERKKEGGFKETPNYNPFTGTYEQYQGAEEKAFESMQKFMDGLNGKTEETGKRELRTGERATVGGNTVGTLDLVGPNRAAEAFANIAEMLTNPNNSAIVQAMEDRFGEGQGSTAFSKYMDMFRKYMDTKEIPENVAEIMDDVQLDFQTVYEEMQESGSGTADSFKQLADAASYAAGVLESLSVPTGGEGSNAKGLDYVPYSGYLTELHKGEAILSGNEAREWRESGGRGQDYNTTGALLGAIQGLGNKLAGMQMYVGEKAFGGVVVDYGGRGMNRYIGGMQQRKRRGLGRR